VVHSLEELKEDNDKNARNLLNAILKFDLILSVVVVEHILQSTVQLSLSLQRVDTDLVQASTEAEVVVALLRQERADDTVWETLYDRATEIAAANEIAPSSPGRTGRQAHRSNTPGDTPSVYWKRVHYLEFIDQYSSDLEQRLVTPRPQFLAQYLIPALHSKLTDDIVARILTAFENDLPDGVDLEHFKREVARWKMRWAKTKKSVGNIGRV
jgi:hypothetical protein